MRFIGCVVLSCGVSLVLGSFAAAESGVMRSNSRQFQLYNRVEPAKRPTMKELQLFVSTDEGQTWRQAARIHPDSDGFRFEAPRDGLYWFKARVIKSDGTPEDGDLSSLPVALKVQVGAKEVKPLQDKDQAVQELRDGIKSLRQQLDKIEQRLSEIEKVKPK